LSLGDFISGALSSLLSAVGVAGTYTASNGSIAISAIPARTQTTRVDSDGVSIMGHVADWIIPVAQLVINGTPILPSKGDKLTMEDGNEYEVNPIVSESYRYTPGNVAIRIHTKVI